MLFLILVFPYSKFRYQTTFVSFTIRPLKEALHHFIFLPDTWKFSSVRPCIFTITLHFVINKLTHIWGFICPFKFSFALFYSLNESTSKYTPVRPNLFPLSMMLVIFPRTFIFSSIWVIVYTETMAFVVQPFPILKFIMVSHMHLHQHVLIVLYDWQDHSSKIPHRRHHPPIFIDLFHASSFCAIVLHRWNHHPVPKTFITIST